MRRRLSSLADKKCGERVYDWTIFCCICQADLPIIQRANVDVDVSRIVRLTCSASCLLAVVLNDKAAGGTNQDAGSLTRETFAAIGTMQTSQFATEMIVTDGGRIPSAGNSETYLDTDHVFEWIRGAAFSGWGFKWPMKRQNVGRRTRRFFVLRGDLLAYHAQEPRSRDEAHADYALHSLRLKPGSTVSRTRRMLQDCIQVETPVDTLWFKSKNKAQHDRWVRLLDQAIQGNSRGALT
jgi:hypothetical protein